MGRRYYYTGPIEAGAADFLTAEDRAAAKAVVRKMHQFWRSIERGEQEHRNLSEDVVRRIENELERRADVDRTALIRVLRCTNTELENIHAGTFDQLPDILMIEDRGDRE